MIMGLLTRQPTTMNPSLKDIVFYVGVDTRLGKVNDPKNLEVTFLSCLDCPSVDFLKLKGLFLVFFIMLCFETSR